MFKIDWHAISSLQIIVAELKANTKMRSIAAAERRKAAAGTGIKLYAPRTTA
jgi:hypothetical protein